MEQIISGDKAKMPMTERFYSVNGQMMGYESGGVKKDFLTDHLGSITAEIDQTQTRTYDTRYSAYGRNNWSTGTGCGFGWVGSYGYRETGLAQMSHYVRARHYSYVTGGWSTVDPLWPDESAFGYGDAWPTYWIDPSGLQGTEVKPPPDLRYPPVKDFPKEPRPGTGTGPKPGLGGGTGGGPKPGIGPRPGGGGGGGIIAVGAQACSELIVYCSTGKPGGPFTGLGHAIGQACFPGTSGQNPGDRDPNCSDKLLAELDANVKRQCKTPGLWYSCEQWMPPSMINVIIERLKRCRNARTERESKCWNGGDQGHQKQIKNIRNAIEKCKKLSKGASQ